jgi:predicted DNA-binding transcriptional regulator YafY
MGSDTTSVRTVEPYGLFFQSGVWYLAGRDTEKDALRNFRVSRMTDVKMNTSKAQSEDYGVPKSFRLTTHARSREAWEIGDGDAEEMIVEFSGESGATRAAAALGAPVGKTKRRSFQVRRVDSFARWLLSFAGEARPVSPPSLVSAYAHAVRETLAVYTEAGR